MFIFWPAIQRAMGIDYTYVAVKADTLPAVCAAATKGEPTHWDTNEGKLYGGEGFGSLAQVFCGSEDPGWAQARRAFCRDPGDPGAEREWDLAAALPPAEAARVAQALDSIPREALAAAIAKELLWIYKEREGVDELRREHLEENLADYEKLIAFLRRAAHLGNAVVLSVG